ncbi:serine/threonine protein kinase [Deinococcus proteolyticus MRP]|uniref:Serine/threonine protein kinase n=1 Tax=Deinococcus proteolyticus (strain ATCC 35074 / DSM 20540 / JCM 6276 / NBRC 101906 / NCIMB 13154 / VKM Ac-1939 / CCM 2703 / MRP) TaxID=693977 RepID=F0RL26_DEIPM|nr:serine/threonine-protein kinase [Deinococcus proteolyticus]ADY25799.1 serine/threonine protein kinase [Deinococcus proteolyticus MRP]
MALAGKRLEGGIRLVRPVGNGSHSVAYLAVTPGGQPCTVKLFQPSMLLHAQRELEVGRQFRHPRLARIARLSRLNDFPALIMGWVPGDTLFAHYRQRPALRCEPYAYLTTLADVLEGLSHMHSLGVLHRDVKPDNILVQPSGHATLVDYDLSGPPGEELVGQIGTPAFRSPEAQLGAGLGPESDLYGVGLLLYWGLWGSLPEPDGPPQPVGDRARTELPFQVQAEALVTQLLEPYPLARPSSAAAVREQLLHWRALLSTPAAVTSPPLRLGRPSQRV